MKSRRKTAQLSSPVDQADGLRRLFASRTMRFVPVVSNPFITHGGVLIERLCSTLDDMGMTTLVVDASERGGPPKELARFDLAEGMEPLSPRINYLAARGLPVRWVDERGSTRAFLDAVADAGAGNHVVLVHASALELVRLFGRGDEGLSRPRPVLLCDDRSESMTHTYAALKILAQRSDWLTHDLLISAAPGSQQARAVADRLGHCVDLFLGGLQRSWVQVDPAERACAAPSPELGELVRGLVAAAARYSATDSQFAALARGAALPATPFNSMN
ncbi:MAG: flagellar biosynthesis protein [Burkholderiales bacterium]|nr:flagellar biosynthesis protein [Burkholderiales bacterium]